VKFSPTKRQVALGILALLAVAGLPRLRAEPQPAFQPAPQVRVYCEWIALPHAEANRLIRNLTTKEEPGSAMHAAAQQLVASGKAKLLQHQLVNITSGQKAKTGTVRQFPYPTGFTSPKLPTTVIVQGGNVIQGDFRKSAPTSLENKNLGFELEFDCVVSADLRHADLNVAATWTTHADDQLWGEGLAEIRMPVFHRCSVFAQALTEHDQWKLVALLRPAVPGPGTAAQPFAEERVLVFIKSVIEGSSPAPRVKSLTVKEIGVFYEWIELDTAAADQLMDSIPASGRTAELRAAAQPLLDTGKATLLESAYLIVRGGQKSKLESMLEFPYPTAFAPTILPQTIIELPAPVPAPAITRPVFWPAANCPQSFQFRNLGTIAEVEAIAGDDGITLDLNASPQIDRLVGIQHHGKGSGLVAQPRFATIQSSTQVLLRRGQPTLLDSFEALPPASLQVIQPGAPPQGNPNRRILLFVTAGVE
jgi:hypothetical protein